MALATQYVFQEPAHIAWSRYLQPEFYWQRQKFPSVRWAFDIVEPLVDYPDPRRHFAKISPTPLLDDMSTWKSVMAGPVKMKATSSDSIAMNSIHVTTAKELERAIKSASPGTIIEIQPGVYDFSGRSIPIRVAGKEGQPIVVRGSEFGLVHLRFDLLEGFQVLAPYWIFENLIIEGVCASDGRCEHAFHVVGAGHSVIIRNNRVTDFNAAVKVNGAKGKFPDDGRIEQNAFINSRARRTGNSVTTLDIVAVNGWYVRKNIIADFAKDGSDHTSYGAFFKGGGESNVFEQNLVRCEWRHAGGVRIGFSFGGGGTSKAACRNGDCSSIEHRYGIARNNIIMNCPNDVGLYLNRSAQTLIHNNAIIDTRGIDVRFAGTSATIANNIVDGRILAREGARYTEATNIVSLVKALFLGKISAEIYANPLSGDFRLNSLEPIQGLGSQIDDPGLDLCGQNYGDSPPDIGPIQYRLDLACTPVLP